jgi:hypothetical protein
MTLLTACFYFAKLINCKGYLATNDRIIVNDESKRMCKVAAKAYFKILL